MRLIDADKLKEEYRDDTTIGRMLKALVDFQPTAYDIDKVVEELKQEKEWVERWGKRYCSQQKVIEIVKAGGKNDNR